MTNSIKLFPEKAKEKEGIEVIINSDSKDSRRFLIHHDDVLQTRWHTSEKPIKHLPRPGGKILYNGIGDDSHGKKYLCSVSKGSDYAVIEMRQHPKKQTPFDYVLVSTKNTRDDVCNINVKGLPSYTDTMYKKLTGNPNLRKEL